MGASRNLLPEALSGVALGELLRGHLRAWPGDAPLVLACSGGVDSTALMLIAAAALGRARLQVVHVHHGLQPDADRWLEHVATQAAALGLSFAVRRLDGRAAAERRFDGLGPEAWARRERYAALAQSADRGGAAVVLTAHHLQDQIETRLLQAGRGAGPRGRAAMATCRPLHVGGARLLRPLLTVPRECLLRVIAQAGWHGVVDPSNADPARPRTSIRAEVRCRLAAEPAAARQWMAAIAADRALAERTRAWAARTWIECRFNDPPQRLPEAMAAAEGCTERAPATGVAFGRGTEQRIPVALSRGRLGRHPIAERAELWRAWFVASGLPLPSRARLAELDRQMVQSSSSRGLVAHGGRWIVRYRDRIGIVGRMPPRCAAETIPVVPATQNSLPVPVPASVRAPVAASVPVPVPVSGPRTWRWRIAIDGEPPASILIGPGRADDRLQLGEVAPRHRLRTLWQDSAIPAWLRPALPTVRDADSGRLLAAFPFGATAITGAEAGMAVRIERPDEGGRGRGWAVTWQPPSEWLPWLAGAHPGGDDGAPI